MIARPRTIGAEALTGLLVIVALIYFVLQTAAFPFQLRPDEYKAVDTFVGMLAGDVVLSSEAFTRMAILLFNAAVTLALARLRLITPETLIIACLWPMTVFLYSKIYWEFFVFPLCLIRHDLGLRGEAGLMIALCALLVVSGESNLAVLLLFRLVLTGQKIGFRLLAPIGFLATGVALSLAMSTGIGASLPLIGSHIARFSWTRNIVNPEYSIFETVAIFVTSFHFFTLHTGLWMIDAAFSALVIGVVLMFPGALQRLLDNWPAILAFGCVVIGLTEVTHAFQNARYYFFYMPIVSVLAPPSAYPLIGILGLAHVGFKAAEAFWLG